MKLTRIRIRGLVAMAAGAILAFGVHVHSPHISVQVVGWVLIVVGGAVAVAPPPSRLRLIRRAPQLGNQPNVLSAADGALIREQIEQQEEDLLRDLTERDELE